MNGNTRNNKPTRTSLCSSLCNTQGEGQALEPLHRAGYQDLRCWGCGDGSVEEPSVWKYLKRGSSIPPPAFQDPPVSSRQMKHISEYMCGTQVNRPSKNVKNNTTLNSETRLFLLDRTLANERITVLHHLPTSIFQLHVKQTEMLCSLEQRLIYFSDFGEREDFAPAPLIAVFLYVLPCSFIKHGLSKWK
ncbi:uncharacterized protein LOC104865459 isoform X2 [Fukomys damarensis]|uniref:uncharacterized protein LOC104865459 isoform X2 n=1 Tax=Fukomys damarensis TaxID=885580 RepID=UPI0005400CD3|nr:uncharacterized protein LOC104865459 isoform X2 [Fukomys damarensis]